MARILKHIHVGYFVKDDFQPCDERVEKYGASESNKRQKHKET